jgi:hypothetical protein
LPPWKIDEAQLLPPGMQDYVPEGHLSRFVVALVRESLDLTEIEASYNSDLGQPPFHPALMTSVLLHGYASGIYSSRRLGKACIERADFRQRRLAKIRAAKAALEAEAKAAAAEETRRRAAAEATRKAEGRQRNGPPPAPPRAEPNGKAQRNFTDPESRILKSKDGFIKGYNAQAGVDAKARSSSRTRSPRARATRISSRF